LIVIGVESFCEKRDSSRFESPFFSTWLESARVTKNCDTSRVTELNHAITDTNFAEFSHTHKKAHFSW